MDLRLRTRPSGAATAGQSESATVVEVAGELDLHSAPQLRAELGRAIESGGAPHVVVDLAGVTFLDSTGVGVLVGALKRARQADGSLHFCGAQPRVRRVFEITGLIGVIPLFVTRSEALESFDSSADISSDVDVNSNANPLFNGAGFSTGEAQ